MAGLLLLASVSEVWGAGEVERLLKQDIDRREQERREQRWDEAHTPGAQPPLLEPAPVARQTGPCFPITHISLHPGDVLPSRRVQRIVSDFLGRCLGSADLGTLQHALNSLALTEGLITTRVVVPEQNLASGRLLLEVWPGRLERTDAPALKPRELTMASPARPGDLLQLRALEQTVDNLNRLASFRTAIELQPGMQPGGSVARLNVVRSRPWQAGLSWQGEALTGEETHTLRANFTGDSLLGLADRLTLGVHGHLQDGQVDNAYGGSLDYDVPMGWSRLSLGTDFFDYENPVHAGLTPFTASGNSRSLRLELAHNLYRDAHDRLSIALHGRRRVNDNFIDGVTIGVSSTRISAVGTRLDFSRVAAPWVWDASLDAEGGEARSPGELSPIDGHYMRLLGNARLQYHFPRLSLAATFNGQWSDSRLAPSEQFTLTGQVPGFVPVSANANTGLAIQLEIARPLLVQRAGFTTVRPSLGLAWALAPHAGGNAARDEVAAISTGLTAPWKLAVLRAALAYPLTNPSTVEPEHRWQLDAGVSLQW